MLEKVATAVRKWERKNYCIKLLDELALRFADPQPRKIVSDMYIQ